MIDEEKAEEYIMREDVDTMKYSECYNERISFEKEVKKAYLDGLAEGKPKWHNLRENPNDLPTKGNVTIRCVLYNGNEVICETDWYSPTEDEIGYGKLIIQFYCNDDWIDTNDVIAWCELPKYLNLRENK